MLRLSSSQFDPDCDIGKPAPCCGGEADFSLYQSAHLNGYNATLRPRGEHEASGIHRGAGGRGGSPFASSAQERVKRPRVGFLMHLTPGDPDAMARIAGFLQGLQELGWATDRNIQIDYRWAVGQDELYRKYAVELVALQPDVLVTTVTDTVRALQRATRTIPIVFTSVIDPVGSGLITSLSHPGGNATGFSLFEFGISGKWLELLKQIAPSVTRVAVLRDSASTRGVGQFAAIQANASSFGVELLPLDAQEGSDIDRAIGAFAGRAGSGLIVTSSPTALINRDLIIKLTAQHRLPAIYPFRNFATGGGLTSYGPDLIDPHRRAAGYVDRILKGEKPADLPVQAPTKYELVINLKTAKALGLDSAADAARPRRRGDRMMSGASSSRCSAARRLRGRSQCARRRGCRSLAFSVEARPRRARIWQRGCAKV